MYLIGIISVTLTTVCSFRPGFYWKLRPENYCFPWSKSTDQGTVHSFPTSGVVCLDFNESRDLWLCRLVGSLLFVKSLTLLSLLHLLMLPNRKATAVEPPAATTSRKRPPLLSDQFSKLPNVSKSNHYI